MADTTYLKYTVEEIVRNQLSEEFGQFFTAKRMKLLTGAMHEFTAVSEHNTIVAEIKSSGGRTAGGTLPAGKIKAAIAELYYLSLVNAHRRILVLTDPEFHAIMVKRMDGALAPGLELKLVKLPEDVQKEVRAIQNHASKEVSPPK